MAKIMAPRPPPLNPRILGTIEPPIMKAHRSLGQARKESGLPLLDLSQAAPSLPPPPQLRNELARLIECNDDVHLYGPVLGLPELRCALAEKLSLQFNAGLTANNIAITSGCNQGFAAVMTAIADAGDSVLLPVPWYFKGIIYLTEIRSETIGVETEM